MYKIFHLELKQPCYRVTLCTANGRNSLSSPVLAGTFIEKILAMKEKSFFFLFSFVILYDHCHLILSPISPYNINDCLKILKSYPNSNEENLPFWDKSRFFSEIRNNEEFRNSLDKDFFDPLKLGLASFREKYPFSSAYLQYRCRVNLAMTGYLPAFILE